MRNAATIFASDDAVPAAERLKNVAPGASPGYSCRENAEPRKGRTILRDVFRPSGAVSNTNTNPGLEPGATFLGRSAAWSTRKRVFRQQSRNILRQGPPTPRFAAALIGVCMFLFAMVPNTAQTAGPLQQGSTATPDATLLNQYCIACHNQRAKTGGLALDILDFENPGKDAPVWEKVVRKIKTGMMPPSGARRPARDVLDAFAAELETRLDRAARLNPNPGGPALHRLNRSEYANVIRDLLALDVDVTTLLPADDATEGFDNIADALGTSPSLIQGYVSAAMKISRRAVGDRTPVPTQITYTAPSGLSQDRHIEGLPLGTRGGMLIHHTFPMDAEYDFSIGSGLGPPGGAGGAAIDVTIDGEKVAVINPRNFRLAVKAGPHTIGVALVDRQR